MFKALTILFILVFIATFSYPSVAEASTCYTECYGSTQCYTYCGQ